MDEGGIKDRVFLFFLTAFSAEKEKGCPPPFVLMVLRCRRGDMLLISDDGSCSISVSFGTVRTAFFIKRVSAEHGVTCLFHDEADVMTGHRTRTEILQLVLAS